MKEYSEHSTTPYYEELRRKGIRLPAVLCQIRTDDGRKAQSRGIDVFKGKFLTPRADGVANNLTTVEKDNLIMIKNDMTTELTYKENPTKEDLLEFYGPRIRIRKMHPVETLLLMDVDMEDAMKLYTATKTVTLRNGKTKTRKAISKTALYRLAGNSIVRSCLYHLFRTMFIPGQPENRPKPKLRQLTIFDMLEE